MNRRGNGMVALLLAAALFGGICSAVALPVEAAAGYSAAAEAGLSAAIDDTAAYLREQVPHPPVGEIGGEWTVLGLARSGRTLPESYYQEYCRALEERLLETGGVLDARKNTTYARAALTLAALGRDPRNFAGYDLVAPLLDEEKTAMQGINGPIWALIALDCGGVSLTSEEAAARERYVAWILGRQLPDGGFSLSDQADPDLTAMALVALSGSRGDAEVELAIGRGVACLASLQRESGGFASWGMENAESVSQVIIALGTLGIPLDDPRFAKGEGLLGNLLGYYREGAGFVHVDGLAGDDQMTTEQAFCALVAAERQSLGKCALYRMEDALFVPDGGAPGEGLPGKHPDVTRNPVREPGKSFADIADHPDREAIEALAARGVIGGRSESEFVPEGKMTRAEFATIVVRALGLSPRTNNRFADVTPEKWYAASVGAANEYGIVYGDSETTFNPEGTITREEAAVMVARAASLCGMDTGREEQEILDALAQFDDYRAVADWAREALAFCYSGGILDDSALTIRPRDAVLRCEIAQMLYRMLARGNLL